MLLCEMNGSVSEKKVRIILGSELYGKKKRGHILNRHFGHFDWL